MSLRQISAVTSGDGIPSDYVVENASVAKWKLILMNKNME